MRLFYLKIILLGLLVCAIEYFFEIRHMVKVISQVPLVIDQHDTLLNTCVLGVCRPYWIVLFGIMAIGLDMGLKNIVRYSTQNIKRNIRFW